MSSISLGKLHMLHVQIGCKSCKCVLEEYDVFTEKSLKNVKMYKSYIFWGMDN